MYQNVPKLRNYQYTIMYFYFKRYLTYKLQKVLAQPSDVLHRTKENQEQSEN